MLIVTDLAVSTWAVTGKGRDLHAVAVTKAIVTFTPWRSQFKSCDFDAVAVTKNDCDFHAVVITKTIVAVNVKSGDFHAVAVTRTIVTFTPWRSQKRL